MSLEKMESLVSRLFFFVAFGLLALAVLERIANHFNYTMLGMRLRAGTVLETAAVLLIFVIAIQLREIREAVKRKS